MALDKIQGYQQHFITSPISRNNDGYQTNQNPLQPSLAREERILMPQGNRNYVLVNQAKVDYFVKQRENALPYIADILGHSNNEEQITETLYIFNRMIDEGVGDTKRMYPVLARFNNTQSPNIQTFLAGIYRKLQVPDAFGPLVKMLIQNSMRPQTSNFDPNEEIGGAILAYLNPRFQNSSNMFE